MKYGCKDVKVLPTKEIDITQFFVKPGGPVKMKIRHYSHYENNEINALLLKGQSFKRGEDAENEISIERFHMGDAFLARMKAGVVIDEDFPFEKWDDDFIKELDQLNPDLTGYINDAITELNRPLEQPKGKNSSG